MAVSNTIIKNIEQFQTSIKLQKISSATNAQCVEGSAEQKRTLIYTLMEVIQRGESKV